MGYKALIMIPSWDEDEVSINIMPFVVCGNCKYWNNKWEQDKFVEKHNSTMPCIEMATSELFFCAFGEPAEKDGDNK